MPKILATSSPACLNAKNAAAEKIQDPDTIDYHVKSSAKARFSGL